MLLAGDAAWPPSAAPPPGAAVTPRHIVVGRGSTMGAGKPVMLSNEYAFSEFPDDCCIKIPIGPDEEDQLLERLIYYIENPDERRALGERSKAYIMKQHDIQDAARGYIEFATELLSS